MIGTVLTFLAMGILSIVAVWIVLSVVGAVLGLTISIAGFLLFKVAPVLLLGWLVLKVFDKVRSGRTLTSSDRKWLEGD